MNKFPRRKSVAEITYSFQPPEVKEKVLELLKQLGVPEGARDFSKPEPERQQALEEALFEDARNVPGEMKDKAMALCGRRNDSMIWLVLGLCLQDLSKSKQAATSVVIDTYAPGWIKGAKL